MFLFNHRQAYLFLFEFFWQKEKVQRQSEYARQIAEKNRQDYLAQNTRPNQRHDQRDVDLEEEAEAMNRRRMVKNNMTISI